MNNDFKFLKKDFYTPELYAKEQSERMIPNRGRIMFAGCRSGSELASKTVEKYRSLLLSSGSSADIPFLHDIDKIFSDTETCIRLDRYVTGYDVYLFQSLYDPESRRPIDQNLMAFLIAVRTFKEHGAQHITGVLPYLAYSRQDKPTNFKREPITARLIADLCVNAGIDRLISWDPHCSQLRGFYGSTPVNMLDPLTMFLEVFKDFGNNSRAIAVAPDVGASKFVTNFSRALKINSAIASKHRPKPEEVVISEIIGDFEGKKTAIVLDDMISNGGTIYSIIKKLVDEKGIEEVYIGTSHNLCVGQAREKLVELNKNYNLKKVIITNSIPQTSEFTDLPFVEVICLSEIMARTINRIHYNQSVSEVFFDPKL